MFKTLAYTVLVLLVVELSSLQTLVSLLLPAIARVAISSIIRRLAIVVVYSFSLLICPLQTRVPLLMPTVARLPRKNHSSMLKSTVIHVAKLSLLEWRFVQNNDSSSCNLIYQSAHVVVVVAVLCSKIGMLIIYKYCRNE
jgi:hypothetical protein